LKRLSLIFSLIIIFFLAVPSFCFEGKISSVKGECEIRKTPEGDFKKALKNTAFSSGDTIRTSNNSYTEISLSGRGVIRLMPETTLTFVFSSDSVNTLSISGGLVIIKYKQANSSEFIRAQTPSAKAEIKDAVLKIYHSGDRSVFVCISGGIFAGSNIDRWRYIEPVNLNKGKKIVLTSLINQTNASITDASGEELYIDSEAINSGTSLTPEVVRLEDFRHEAEQAERAAKRKKETGFNLNFAFGGILLDNQSYFSIALRPEFTYEDFSLALYLPFYLKGDRRPWFSSSWGNIGEWNFKSAHDTLGDLLIKIDYLKWGRKGSKYYIYLGRLENFSFGNGFVVNNLNNIESYPLIKRNGFYAETDWDYLGFQMFISDVNIADIQGYRFFVRPFALKSLLMQKLEIGLIATFDTKPRGVFRNNPSLFAAGLDFKIPVYKKDKLSLAILVDFIKQGYRFSYKSEEALYTLPSSDKSSGLSFFKGFGADIAVEASLSKILTAKAGYVLAYKGTSPEWMDVFYMIIRKNKAESIINTSNEYTRHGFFAEAHAVIKNAVYIKAKYMLLSGKTSGQVFYDDKIHFSVGLIKGALWKLHLAFSYDRIDLSGNFFKNIMNKAILTVEAGVYWSESVSFMASYRRFFDIDLNKYTTFLLETRLEF
jgi:hypothetical protein